MMTPGGDAALGSSPATEAAAPIITKAARHANPVQPSRPEGKFDVSLFIMARGSNCPILMGCCLRGNCNCINPRAPGAPRAFRDLALKLHLLSCDAVQ